MPNDPKNPSTIPADVGATGSAAVSGHYERATTVEKPVREGSQSAMRHTATLVSASRLDGTISVRLVPAFSRKDDVDTSR